MKKKRVKRNQILINYRDRELFNYLYEVKVATREQINRDVFKGVSKTVIYRRLKKLIERNYLKRGLYFNGRRAVCVYSLSKTALRLFIFSKESDEFAIKRCFSDSIEHDILLNDIRHRLLSCEHILDYYSENVLASNAPIVEDKKFEAFKRLHSDGLIFIQKAEKTLHFAVEYEHSLKYTKRYERLFFDYHFERDVDGVLYICGSEKVLKRVKDAELKVSKNEDQKVCFALLQDILNDSEMLQFKTSSERQTLTIT